MYNVAVIGCGNLGSRHLQALKLTKKSLAIIACEPDKNARAVSLDRFKQVSDNGFKKELIFLENYENLAGNFDLIIIATNSVNRFIIAKWILQNIDVRFIILEKVAFQSINEIDMLLELLSHRPVKVWVNCPRRMYGFYKDLKTRISGRRSINMIEKGMEWGMACNTIHFLDLYQFLTGFTNCEYDNEKLIEKSFNSKRMGYTEFYGSVEFFTNKGKLTLECEKGESAYDQIIISTEEEYIEINENTKHAIIMSNGKQDTIHISMDIAYQSNLTNVVMEQLIDTEECELCTYEESAYLHKVMLSCFLNHINKYSSEEVTKCPIT